MKFFQITAPAEEAALQEDYQKAHKIGVLSIGDAFLFFRIRLRTYFIPFSDIRRCFRRVMLVPARMCCGRGDLEVENLVVCGDNGELAQIQLPGAKAGKAAIAELREKLPGIAFTKPEVDAG